MSSSEDNPTPKRSVSKRNQELAKQAGVLYEPSPEQESKSDRRSRLRRNKRRVSQPNELLSTHSPIPLSPFRPSPLITSPFGSPFRSSPIALSPFTSGSPTPSPMGPPSMPSPMGPPSTPKSRPRYPFANPRLNYHNFLITSCLVHQKLLSVSKLSKTDK